MLNRRRVQTVDFDYITFMILDDKTVQRLDIDEVILDHICGSVVQRFDIDVVKSHHIMVDASVSSWSWQYFFVAREIII